MNLISFYKGESIQLNFTQRIPSVQGQPALPTDPAQDITAWTIEFTLRNNATDAAFLVQQNAVLDTAASGTYHVTLTHAQTVLLASGVYAYDIQRIDAGSEAVLSVGSLTVQQEVLY